MLQMPPVKKAWDIGKAAKSNVLSTDDISMWELSGSRYVFTDITYGLPHRVSYFIQNLVQKPDARNLMTVFCSVHLPFRSQAVLQAVRCTTMYSSGIVTY